jgi:dihydroxyacetone kinase
MKENDRHIRPERILCSSYMTSLNGPGFSISLLNIGVAEKQYKSAGSSAIDILELIDLPTEASAWQGCVSGWKTRGQSRDLPESRNETGGTQKSDHPSTTRVKDSTIRAVTRACNSVLEAEEAMTRYDTIVGDGDCGATWAKGAQGIPSIHY